MNYAPVPDSILVRLGSQLVDGNVPRVGNTLRGLSYAADGTRMGRYNCPPAATPPAPSEGHRRDFCVEFRSWAAIAVSDGKDSEALRSYQEACS